MKNEKKENIHNNHNDNELVIAEKQKETLIKDENSIKESLLEDILGKAKPLKLNNGNFSIIKKLSESSNNNTSEEQTGKIETNNYQKIIDYYKLIIKKLTKKNSKENTDMNKSIVNKYKVNNTKINISHEDNGIQLFYELFLRKDKSKLSEKGNNLFNLIIEKYGIDKNQLLLKNVILEFIKKNNWKFDGTKNELPFYKEGNNLYFNRIISEDSILLKDTYVSDWLIYSLNQEYIVKYGENPLNIEGVIKDEFWSLFEENTDLKISHALEILSKNNYIELNQIDLKVHLVNYLKNGFVDEFKSNEGNKALIRFDKLKEKWEKIFSEKGLPDYCSFLAMTESRVDPSRTSNQGAGGYFGFMPQTALKYGLKVGNGLDERLDPVKSAQAAASLLVDEKKHRYNHILYQNFKDKINKTEEYTIKEGDTIPKIARNYNTNGEIILEFNPGIIHNKLKIGDTIRIPTGYNITDNELSIIETDSFYLALASYNGFIAKQLDVKNYDEYLSKISSLISIINSNKNKLRKIANKMKKGSSNVEYFKDLEFCISIYTQLSNLYPGKYKNSIFQNRLNSLQTIKKSNQINNKGVVGILMKGNKLEIVNRYNNILLQNLTYPANLLAARDAYKEINNGK
ncbi:MAG: lytic transglycosylase [Candidatus Absconditabacteria bacterium]